MSATRCYGLFFVCVEGETLKAKWKGLRDNFRVEFKRIPRTENDELAMDAVDFDSKWTFYKNLLFLSEFHTPLSFEIVKRKYILDAFLFFSSRSHAFPQPKSERCEQFVIR